MYETIQANITSDPKFIHFFINHEVMIEDFLYTCQLLF